MNCNCKRLKFTKSEMFNPGLFKCRECGKIYNYKEGKEIIKRNYNLSDPIIQRERLDLELFIFGMGYKVTESFSGKDKFVFKISKDRR